MCRPPAPALHLNAEAFGLGFHEVSVPDLLCFHLKSSISVKQNEINGERVHAAWCSQTGNLELLLTEAAPEPETIWSRWQVIGPSELILGSCLKTVFAETCAAMDSYCLWHARGLFSNYCQIMLFLLRAPIYKVFAICAICWIDN